MSDDAGPNPVIPLDLFAAGDPRFVAALRGVADSAALAAFAAPWHADARPEARRLLFAYLDEAPNAPGHEGLVKRLFKLAEAAGDDAVMARFLVLGDRLIRHHRRAGRPVLIRYFPTLEAAERCEARWLARGWKVDRAWWPLRNRANEGRHRVRADRRPITIASTRDTTLPRPDWREGEALARLTATDRAGRRWFSVATRRHLQRRAWRYFRHLGRTDPDRYVAAAEIALGLYRDAELADGFALLDHFGLIRLLFEGSPVLRFKSSGCDLAPGRTLAELAPAPSFPAIWADRPEAVMRILTEARALVVGRWAARMIEADRGRFAGVGATAWVDLLDRDDPAVVGLALAMLDGLGADRLSRVIPPGRWVEALEQATPANREPIATFILPIIRDARAEGQAEWVGILLASRDATARAEGWAWFRADRSLRDDPGLWSKVVESPYPDIRAAIAEVRGLVPVEPRRLAEVWAAILLDLHGAARLKPGVIRRVVARLEAIADGEEADALLGLLATVARSARAPERRAALVALVVLVERRPGWAGRVEALVPALQLGGGPAIVPA